MYNFQFILTLKKEEEIKANDIDKKPKERKVSTRFEKLLSFCSFFVNVFVIFAGRGEEG